LLNVALNTITLIPSIPSFLNSFYFIINIAEILLAGRKGTINQQINSNTTSFFRFVNKRAIYRLGKISLAHVPVHVTDFCVVNVHVDELSSAWIWQHKLCATLSANVNTNYRLPIKVYYCICTLRQQNWNNSWKPECVLKY
jgi:hypothetical protein